MRISAYTPKLTVAEADRRWMPALDICELAVIGDADKPEVRRFLNNVSEKGHIPFEKPEKSKTSPKLYSCISAIMLRVMREITASGRPYEFASPIAAYVGELARQLITECEKLDDIDTAEADWLVLYETSWNGQAEHIRTVRASELNSDIFSHHYDVGLFSAGAVIWNVLRNYPDYWARDRVLRGLDRPAGRYDGCDLNGYPLDPGHSWNRDLPPLERAKRLLEIEEYIARREAEQSEQAADPAPNPTAK